MQKLLILLWFFMLAGCAGGYTPTPPPPASSLVAPVTYRGPIAAQFKATLRDPTSVRDARISQPFVRHMGAGERYVVCVRLNAKNGFGGYSGPVDRLAVFVGGELLSIVPTVAGECREVAMTPFSEI
jgi:hypothetical protein